MHLLPCVQGESPPISAGVIAVVVISFVVIFGLGFVGVLYYLRYPIPFIGKMLYARCTWHFARRPRPPPAHSHSTERPVA